jgi:DNA-binding transcriptional LysR family regulator
MAYQWVMPRLTDLRRAHPETRVALIVSEDYADHDAQGADLALWFGDGGWPGRRADLILPETVAPIAAPSLLEARPELRPPVDPAALDPSLLLHHEPQRYGWLDWPGWFAEMGAPAPDFGRIRGERNYSVLIDMALAGEGVALGELGLIEAHMARGSLVALRPAVRRPRRGYWLVSSAGGLEAGAEAIRLRLSAPGVGAPVSSES